MKIQETEMESQDNSLSTKLNHPCRKHPSWHMQLACQGQKSPSDHQVIEVVVIQQRCEYECNACIFRSALPHISGGHTNSNHVLKDLQKAAQCLKVHQSHLVQTLKRLGKCPPLGEAALRSCELDSQFRNQLGTF